MHDPMLDADRFSADPGAAAEAYVQRAFGLRLDLEPVVPDNLPHFLIDRYDMWKGTLLDRPLLIVRGRHVRPGAGFTADFIKHREILRRALDVPLVILFLDPAPAAIRRQMVERRVGFLAPGNQLYIPEALIDLRERGTRVAPEPADGITPSAQLIILAALLGEDIADASLTVLATRLQVAIMSMSRAVDELEALQLAGTHLVGRQRRLQLRFRDRELWDNVRDRLQSPVRKVRIVRGPISDATALRAGTTALSQYTMLAQPRIECRAIAATRWRNVGPELERAAAVAPETEPVELQTWSYDPFVLAQHDTVDPLSLYLSLRNDPDERVAQAADELLDAFQW